MPATLRFRAVAVAAALSLSADASIAQDALPDLPAADIVLLGEVHDNPAHHRIQAEALARIAPAAVAFEMLTAEQAAIVNDLGPDHPDHPDLAEALDWAESGWPDFALYAPVFEAVGGARVFGMALSRDDVRRAMGEGAAAVFGEGAGRYALTAPLPDAQQGDRQAAQQEAHCNALPDAMLPGFVEAQRLRDAAFARTVLDALDATGGPVAVITGTGHVRKDWGMPQALAAAAPEVSVLAIGQVESDNGLPADLPPFDLVLAAPPADRPDPCEAFLNR